MHRNLRRRFTLLDAVIIVASIGLGFGLLRLRITFADLTRFFRSAFDRVPWELPTDTLVLRLSGLIELALPCVLAWTLGLLILRFVPPRPPLRRLARQPGFVACVVFLVISACSYLSVLVTLATRGKLAHATVRDLIAYHSTANLLMIQIGGWGIAAAWIVLGISGRWRPEPSWIDRFGRGFGVFWLGSALIMTDLMNSVLLNL